MNLRQRALLTSLMTLLCCGAFSQQPTEPKASPAAVVFQDVTAEAGLTFRHTSAPEKKYIVESMSGGLALLDYDNDGWLDIFLVNACTVDNATDPQCSRSALYHNQRNGKYVDVAEKAGVAYVGWGMGACVADVDADGFDDIYVTTLGESRLYRNRGDGTFQDLAPKAGVTAGGWAAGCGFADYDRDGDLDLFVSRYVKLDLKNLPQFGASKTCQYRGIPVQCGPRGLPGSGDLLYRNNGDGTFSEVGEAAGVSDPNGYFGLGVAWFDYNGDGFPDLFVANDSNPNFLYKNLGNGKFADVAFPAGVAVSEDGSEQGCMGVALGDYNRDGRLDLFVTNFSEEYNALYRQDADGNFTDASFASRTAQSSLPYVGWGTAFFDYDNDGWPDLLAVNGHVYPQLENAKLGASGPYRQGKLLYRNLGNGTFADTSALAGSALQERRVSRGTVFGDLDNDGDVDAVVNDLDGVPTLLRNDGGNAAGNWLSIKLVGKQKNRNAIGAVLKVVVGGRPQVQVVRSGSSYLSQDDFRLHFGLGTVPQAEAVEITWPDGTVTTRSKVPVNQFLVVSQP
jgi:hypothetical protein